MNNLLTILLTFLAAVGYTESRTERSSPSERLLIARPIPVINYNASGLFNPATEKCCLGSVHPSKKANFDICCGSDVIDSSKQLCCGGVITPLVPGESCCGKQTINTDNAICCENVEFKVTLEEQAFLKCCGKQIHDTRKQTCCTSGIDSFVLEGANKVCCGDKTYDSEKENCCIEYINRTFIYNVLTKEGKKIMCCSKTLYDQTSEICCNRQVVPITKGCCVNQIYDIDTEICCAGRYPNVNSSGIVKKTDPNQKACCGMEPYDSAKEVCCLKTKKIIPKSSPDHFQCCGDQTYFGYDKGICCDDVLFADVSRMTHVCCGNKAMNRSANTCCQGQILEKSKLLCCGDTGTYDPATHICCNKYFESNKSEVFTILPKTSNTMYCCGPKGYDPARELCCGQQVLPNSGNTECCGSKSYEKDKEVCCNWESVFTKENGRESCCLYSTTDEFMHYPIRDPYRY